MHLGGEIIPGVSAKGAGGGGGPCSAALALPGWEYNYSERVKKRKSKLVAFKCMSRDWVSTARPVSCPVLLHLDSHISWISRRTLKDGIQSCSSIAWQQDFNAFFPFAVQHDPELSPRQFGVELSRLTSEERAVPLLVEKLINYIEMHGLYTEGIYRKSGSTNKIKELRQGLDTGKRRGERSYMARKISAAAKLDGRKMECFSIPDSGLCKE